METTTLSVSTGGGQTAGPSAANGSEKAMETTTLSVSTGGGETVRDLTGDAERFVAGRGDGLLSVFVPHATAGLALIELGSGSEADLLAVLRDLLPPDDRWRHAHGSRGHGRSHVMPAMVVPSLTVPVLGGRLALGTWQSIALVDLNVDNARRTVRLSFLSG
jgi:secondary thiamine-phosphate synthase enzyme